MAFKKWFSLPPCGGISTLQRFYIFTQHVLYSSDTLPAYNYGLVGKGKSKRIPSDSSLPHTQGEVLFGFHSIRLALKASKRKKFHGIFTDTKLIGCGNSTVNQLLDLASHFHIPIYPVSKDILDQLAGNRPHQGMCMDVSKLETPLWCDSRTLPKNPIPLWLLLHNIQDPMNFGAILRSAYYLGCDSVVVPGSDSCKLSPVVSKASAGAMEVVDLMRITEDSTETDLCRWWKQQGGEVVGTGRGGNKPCTLEMFKMRRPTLLVLGNEGTGIGRQLEECCDICLFIPQSAESIDSLNVSVATGIILHWIKTSRTLDVLPT